MNRIIATNEAHPETLKLIKSLRIITTIIDMNVKNDNKNPKTDAIRKGLLENAK